MADGYQQLGALYVIYKIYKNSHTEVDGQCNNLKKINYLHL